MDNSTRVYIKRRNLKKLKIVLQNFVIFPRHFATVARDFSQCTLLKIISSTYEIARKFVDRSITLCRGLEKKNGETIWLGKDGHVYVLNCASNVSAGINELTSEHNGWQNAEYLPAYDANAASLLCMTITLPNSRLPMGVVYCSFYIMTRLRFYSDYRSCPQTLAYPCRIKH